MGVPAHLRTATMEMPFYDEAGDLLLHNQTTVFRGINLVHKVLVS